MNKFTTEINSFKYILSFDLAKGTSGYSVMAIPDCSIVTTGLITTIHLQGDFPVWGYIYEELCKLLTTLQKQYNISLSDVLVTKEKLPVQAGPRSTIKTLQSLAQVHAIVDLWCQHNHMEVYDYEGVHSVSVKAFFKHLTGIEKPTKQDIADHLSLVLNDPIISTMDLNITDSIAVAYTLYAHKWNADIDTRIKELKKEQKKFKTEAKKELIQHEIDQLLKLKKEDNNGTFNNI